MRIKNAKHFVESLRNQAREIWLSADSLERHFLTSGTIGRDARIDSNDPGIVKQNILAVEKTLDRRRKRERAFPSDIFGEPSWEVLLNLYRSAMSGEEISITKASYMANCPPSSALRVIADLIERELVTKQKVTGGRKVIVSISQLGIDSMNRYFDLVADAIPTIFAKVE